MSEYQSKVMTEYQSNHPSGQYIPIDEYNELIKHEPVLQPSHIDDPTFEQNYYGIFRNNLGEIHHTFVGVYHPHLGSIGAYYLLKENRHDIFSEHGVKEILHID